MKKTATLLLASAAFLCSTQFMNAQENSGISPYSFTHQMDGNVPVILMPAHDFSQDIKDAEAFEKAGNYPRFARHFDVNQTMLNAGTWTEVGNGDRVWRLDLKSKGALSTDLFFDNFFIPEGATLHVYTPDHKQVSGSYTSLDNQGNGLFSTEFLSGDEQTIEYFEPAAVRGQGSLRITQMAHQYRVLPMADPCEVNIICSPEGDNWQDEKRGVCRVYVVEGSSAGYCSGTLINNTSLDCTRYILTAFHCGTGATTANFNSWKFYFNYEATTCTGGDGGTLTNVMTGCTKKADAGDGGGDSGSDFLLLQMTSTASPSWWPNVYWNGWSNANTAPPAGSIGIHHPAGTNKKISMTTGTGTSTSWGGTVANTHWQIHWGGTTNGWGVTEGGSSGSPLFNLNSQVIGTLTGGGSYCNTTVAGGQNQPDAYGKIAFDWVSNGTTAANQLKPWLDPGNTGAISLNGSYSPCTTGVGIATYESDNAFMVYPNPNNGAFNVSVKLDKQADVVIRVVNVIGQEVMTKLIPNTVEGTYNIDLSAQPTGIYFVQMKAGDKVVVKKINIVK
ncbi:MAG: hypothetical protein JWP12_1204 [Bacteroidetes bacterium]|nr:hypothetical protein [Bacteroidota bacterium]